MQENASRRLTHWQLVFLPFAVCFKLAAPIVLILDNKALNVVFQALI